ncbi:MAG: 50S ribosomal protein L9 [Pseudohongiellaceae bacterium]
MNIILLEKIVNLGNIGDTAEVKSGFARNFLFPQGKAIPASKQNLAEFESRRAELLAAQDANIAQAQKRQAVVHGKGLIMHVNASDEGKLFGSVGTQNIADSLNEQFGSDIVKAEVLLPHGFIRELGRYEIDLDLGYEVTATISLDLQGLDAAASVSDDGSVIEEVEEAESTDIPEAGAPEESAEEDSKEA